MFLNLNIIHGIYRKKNKTVVFMCVHQIYSHAVPSEFITQDVNLYA